jgi:hypothetical protein
MMMVTIMMLVLGVGGPNIAQAMFHDHIENLGKPITDLFKPKPDPIFLNSVNDGQRIINDLHSKYPNITQEDVTLAYHAITMACLQDRDLSSNMFGTVACNLASHTTLIVYFDKWGYNYLVGTSPQMPPQLASQQYMSDRE